MAKDLNKNGKRFKKWQKIKKKWQKIFKKWQKIFKKMGAWLYFSYISSVGMT